MEGKSPSATAGESTAGTVGVETGTASSEASDADELIGGRYRLGPRLGAGSLGVVCAAEDVITGAQLAIKMLHPTSADERRRVLREVAALRALQVPGVVPLHDEGRHGARHFIAMGRVDGTPFPGAGAGREAVIDRIEALLRILDRVHATGIVHRDLKPANVLVTGAGEVVVLDFGLARGGSLGATMTGSGVSLGTPRYMAPEQLRGMTADGRADLYAVGLMAFEALADRPAHPGDSLPLLMRARLMGDAPRLVELVPDLPPRVAALVDRLLERDVRDRPQTAAEALSLLTPAAPTERWPWLGSREPIEQIIECVAHGRTCAVGGPRRSGRSRCVAEVARALAESGRTVRRLVPGERPFASLRGVVDPSMVAGQGPLPPRVRAAVQALLDAGEVIIADDTVDRWTTRALDGVHGSLVRVVQPNAPADVALGPLGVADVHPLFAGPDRIFHLAEDAAAALIDRAGGLRADLIDELSTWVRDAVARRTDGQLAVDRAALQQAMTRPRGAAGGVDAVDGPLADVVAAAHLIWPESTLEHLALVMDRPTWEVELALLELGEQGAIYQRADRRWEPRAPASALPAWTEARRAEAHRRMTTALPKGAASRLTHAIAASELGAIAEEAAQQLDQAHDRGLGAEGIGQGREALRALRRERSIQPGAMIGAWPLVEAMVRLACEEDGRRHIPDVRAELSRMPDTPRRARLGALLDAAAGLSKAEPATLRAQIGEVDAFDDPRTELARLNVWATAAIYESAEASEAVLDAIEPWFEHRSGDVRARFDSWRGNLLYRQGRYDEAARLHLAAAAQRRSPRGQLSCLANATYALIEAFELEQAREIAARLVTEAARRRQPTFEAIGEQMIRACDYRAGRATTPDVELTDAAESLPHVTLAAMIALNEAAIAWRAGQPETCRSLAETAIRRARRSGQRAVSLLAEGLVLLSLEAPSPAAAEALVTSGQRISLPRIAAQIIGIGRMVHPNPPAAWRAEIASRAASLTAERQADRLEVLSLAEALGAS